MNSQIKILLADESAVFLEQLRHVLERDPAFVIAGSANDAQRAVELLHRTQPDILILGLLLPERDGVSVLTAANALPRPPMTLALTGALTEQDAQKLEALGVRYMIRKPCKLAAVAACVRKMLAAVQEMSHLSSDAEALIDGVLRELGVPDALKAVGICARRLCLRQAIWRRWAGRDIRACGEGLPHHGFPRRARHWPRHRHRMGRRRGAASKLRQCLPGLRTHAHQCRLHCAPCRAAAIEAQSGAALLNAAFPNELLRLCGSPGEPEGSCPAEKDNAAASFRESARRCAFPI